MFGHRYFSVKAIQHCLSDVRQCFLVFRGRKIYHVGGCSAEASLTSFLQQEINLTLAERFTLVLSAYSFCTSSGSVTDINNVPLSHLVEPLPPVSIEGCLPVTRSGC